MLKLRCENVEHRADAGSVVTFTFPEGGRIFEVAAHGPFMVLMPDATGYEIGQDYEIAAPPAPAPPDTEEPEAELHEAKRRRR